MDVCCPGGRFPFVQLWRIDRNFILVHILHFRNLKYPTIAQLAERETVEARQLSLGHWFESGWSETFFVALLNFILISKLFQYLQTLKFRVR